MKNTFAIFLFFQYKIFITSIYLPFFRPMIPCCQCKMAHVFLFLGTAMLIKLVFAIPDTRLEQELIQKLASPDVQTERFGNLPNSLQNIMQSCADVIIVSEKILPRPIDSGIAMLYNLPETPTVLILHDSDSARKHAEIMAAGADVALSTRIPLHILVEAIEATLDSRRQLFQVDRFERRTLHQPKLSDFLSTSETMQIFINDVQQVAASDSVLLILGETGVGKEHLAKAIHSDSPRAGRPFVALNAAALPEQLLESELFGHTRGSFTGATRSRRGAFEQAHGGTIFLDEIGEMPLHLQTKLLRVLQDYEVRPIGSDKSIFVDVRVIAATNRDLDVEVQQGNFRKDLFYRLSVMTLTIPPLRNRREDIPALTRRFLNYFRYKIGKDITGITQQALQALSNYDWPGNVRELMNVIERAMLLCKSNQITILDLPVSFQNYEPDPVRALNSSCHLDPSDWQNKTLPEVRSEITDVLERLYIEMILTQTRGRINKAALKAGIHTRALYNKMKRLHIRKEDFK